MDEAGRAGRKGLDTQGWVSHMEPGHAVDLVRHTLIMALTISAVMLALVLAAGLVNRVKTMPHLPDTTLQLAAGIGGELIFGLIMGLGLSLAFIAVSWAGEMMGQQMGLNIAETFDPQFGRGGSLV